MSGLALFNFSARFLSAVTTTTPLPGRKSKMFTRRMEMRMPSEWIPAEEVFVADEIITAPAIADINVVEFEPELVSTDEITAVPPAIVAAKHIEGTPGVVPSTDDIKPAATDQDDEVLHSLEDVNSGKLLQNDVLLEPGDIAPEITSADELTVADSTIAAVSVPLVPASDDLDPMFSAITSAMPADIMSSSPVPSVKKVKKRGKKTEFDGLASFRRNRSSLKVAPTQEATADSS